ncbi:MAG: DUF6172 family protein [Pseudorhodoferax sp.]
MRKTYPLQVEGKHPDRLLDAIKHDIRKYIKRERRRELPEGMDFWDFDCRFGADEAGSSIVHLSDITGLIDGVAKEGGRQFYVEILARPAKRRASAASAGLNGSTSRCRASRGSRRARPAAGWSCGSGRPWRRR